MNTQKKRRKRAEGDKVMEIEEFIHLVKRDLHKAISDEERAILSTNAKLWRKMLGTVVMQEIQGQIAGLHAVNEKRHQQSHLLDDETDKKTWRLAQIEMQQRKQRLETRRVVILEKMHVVDTLLKEQAKQEMLTPEARVLRHKVRAGYLHAIEHMDILLAQGSTPENALLLLREFFDSMLFDWAEGNTSSLKILPVFRSFLAGKSEQRPSLDDLIDQALAEDARGETEEIIGDEFLS